STRAGASCAPTWARCSRPTWSPTSPRCRSERRASGRWAASRSRPVTRGAPPPCNLVSHAPRTLRGASSEENLLMLLIFIVTLGATLIIQMYLRNTYARWGQQPAASGLTGAQTARAILDANGLTDVAVEEVPGQLTDHYDPAKRVVRLSTHNYRTASVAAHAVAAHEVGHAIQHAKAYAPLRIRTALVPIASIGANFAPWVIIAGAVMGAFGLV